MEKKIKVENIKVAEIREFDVEHNGVAMNFYSYLFLLEKDGVYINPFDVFEDYPIYKRLPYSNTTLDGEDFGSKIKLIHGEEKDGPCIVLSTKKFSNFTDLKEFSLEQLENIVLLSSRYFKDREKIVKERFKYNPIIKNKYMRKDRKDKENLEKMIAKYEFNKKLLRK